MLLHLVSLEHEDPLKEYYTIREELSEFDESLTKKEEWVILTKKDLVEQEFIDSVVLSLEKIEKRVLVVGQNDKESYKQVSDMLTAHLKNVE